MLIGASIGDRAGSAVAFLDGAVAVGAPYLDALATDAGGVYFATWPLEGEVDLGALGALRAGIAANDQAGSALATGDVDGDGHADLLVGAPQSNAGATQGGAAYLVLGPLTGSGSLALADATLLGATYDQAGTSLASGDLDGDGFADLVVGAPYGDYAAVFYGPVTGSADLSAADARLLGSSDYAGWSVASVGDADGDGLDDLLVGAFWHSAASGWPGGAFLVTGPPSFDLWLDTSATAVLEGVAGGDYAGWSVAGPGDVDGDGHADLLVGALADDTAGIEAGAAYLVSGAVTGVVSLAAATATFTGESAGAQLGYSVAAAGDVDGDGTPDLLAGAPLEDCSGGCSGAVYLWLGPVTGTLDASMSDGTWLSAWSDTGRALASGDVDGDGLSDLLLGGPFAGDAGVAALVLGTSVY